MLLSELFKRSKSGPALLMAAVSVLLLSGSLYGQTPNLSGSWQMDTAKSQVSDGRDVTLVIETVSGKIKISSSSKDKAGKETTGELLCAPDGKECEFDEGGHKSKVSMWFAGPSLNMAKTDGPVGDVVNEWKLDMSADGKVLTLTVNHIDPTGADETLVFNTKPS